MFSLHDEAAAVVRRQRELLRPAQRPPEEQGERGRPAGGGCRRHEAPLPDVRGTSARRERLRRCCNVGLSGVQAAPTSGMSAGWCTSRVYLRRAATRRRRRRLMLAPRYVREVFHL